jgi:putative transposase
MKAPAMVPVPLVLQMFALLFSSRWIQRWQRQWWQEHKALAAPTGQAGARGNRAPARTKKKKKNKTPSRFNQRIFSLRVTLWYLIYQRLSFDHTLAAVVRNVRDGGADRLGPRGRKLSKRLRSSKTGAYSQARQRVPLELLQAALDQTKRAVLKMIGLAPTPRRPPGPNERTRQLFDGSTLAVLLTPLLFGAYPPARNQVGQSDWCLIRIVVGFCVRSGAVLSAIQGTIHQSEQALTWVLMEKAAAFTIWIGDRNFGVWSVVAQAVHFHQDVVVRMTRSRANRLAGGRPLQSGEDRALEWQPTQHDQVPPGVEVKPIHGRLLYVRLQREGRWIDLWLFTTLDAQNYPLEMLVRWYGQRWQAELHFRSVKTQMNMATLSVCSPEMARKEFYAGLLAYSLVRAVMWAAGERLEQGVQTLSFSQARRVLLDALKDWSRVLRTHPGSNEAWVRRLISEVMQETLPKRKRKRPNEPRKIRRRASKFPTLRGSRAAARKHAELAATSM